MAVIRLHLTLIEMAGDRKEVSVDARQPVSLTALLDQWGVPHEEVGIIVRNHRRDEIDCMVHDEDIVELFPILSGG